MQIKTIFKRSFIAGVLISIGGMVFLSVGGGTLGAFMFSIGLLCVLRGKAMLFTGKVPYMESLEDLRVLLLVLCGNLCGTFCMGAVYRLACPSKVAYAVEIATNKTSEGWRVIPLAMLCNVMIYIAVEAYKNLTEGSERAYPIIVLCVMVFILSGFEHCVANAFYFTVAGIASKTVALYLIWNIVGNALGGIIARKIHG